MASNITKADLEALSRVVFIDSRYPSNTHTALFNPESVTISTEVNQGTLEPIGWSSSVQQYASTGARTMSIALKYSYLAFRERGLSFLPFDDASLFFQAFTYAYEKGGAPPHMIVIWPKTVYMACIVKSVEVTFSRWDVDMNVREYSIDLDLEEATLGDFYTNNRMRAQGFVALPRALGTGRLRGAVSNALFGSPLTITKRR